MTRDYNTVAPVTQFDEMACWAASMEWWLSYMSPTRPVMTQYDVIAIKKVAAETFYPEDYDTTNFGGLTKKGMDALFGHPPFKMQKKRYGIGNFSLLSIKKRISKSPLVIIYNDGVVGGYHANVIVSLNQLYGYDFSVTAMDPRTGTFEPRFLSWYTSDELYIGWAK